MREAYSQHSHMPVKRILAYHAFVTCTASASQAKRHIKRSGDNPGGIITTESPLHYSNVQLVDPVTKAPVRSTWRFLEDGSKVHMKCSAPLTERRGGVHHFTLLTGAWQADVTCLPAGASDTGEKGFRLDCPSA
jgi:ribosomal protein L24